MDDTIRNSKNVQVALEIVCKDCKDFEEHVREGLTCSGQTVSRNMGFEDLLVRILDEVGNMLLKTAEGRILII